TVDVTVVTPAGTSSTSAADHFQYVNALPPSVLALDVTQGPVVGGTTVVLTGLSFSNATQVYFGNVAATSFTVRSDTRLSAVAPPQSAGAVAVTVVTAAGTSAVTDAGQFTYTQDVPTVTGLGTTSGPTAGGTLVTISGTNFTGATGVSFGGRPAALF